MIVITGASDGLGRELAKLFKSSGKRVVNISRSKSVYANDNILCDLREGKAIEAAAAKIADIEEALEILINCAGVISLEELGSITESEIKRVMATNVKHPILLVSSLIDRIKKDGTDIVNVSSTVGAKAGYSDQAVYTASKWAVRGFSQNLQMDLKDTQCRVISFCPGGMADKFHEKASGEPLLDPENWMSITDIAKLLKQLLDLPKNIEVSEILINRKAKK